MRTPFVLVWIFAAGSITLGGGGAEGQNYPNRPIRVVTAEVGGGSDFVARLIAQGITASVGQQVVVDNRGGSVVIPAGIVAQAPADGYTVLLSGNPLWFLPLLQDSVPYDIAKDFSPITLVDASPHILVVHPAVAANSVKELIALAKAKPGALNYSAGVTGSTPHLAAELFKSMASINIARISYKGVGPAVTALIGGEVQLMFVTTAAGIPHIKSGRLRPLAVTSAKPSALVPGLPALAASGLPGYESINTHGLFVPGKTPAALINRLNQETVRFLSLPATKEKLLNAGLEAVVCSPQEFSAAIKSDTLVWGKLIKDAGIRSE